MANILSDEIVSEEQLSQLLDKVFGDIVDLYCLRLKKPFLRPLSIIGDGVMEVEMAFVLPHSEIHEDLDVPHNEPLIVFSKGTLEFGLPGWELALMLAHEIGHYAHVECALDSSPIVDALDNDARLDNLTLRDILAEKILSEGIAVTFEKEYLLAMFARQEISRPIVARVLNSFDRGLEWVLDIVSERLERSDIYRTSKTRDSEIYSQMFDVSGPRIYRLGKSLVQQLRNEKQLSIRSLLLASNSLLESPQVQAVRKKWNAGW